MTTVKQRESTNHQSFCLNLDCQHPENPIAADICESCGSPLVIHGDKSTTGNFYRAIRVIGRGGFGRTLLAIVASRESQPYCVIKQFFPEQKGNQAKASELFRQEAQRLQTLGDHAQIPKLIDYFEYQAVSGKPSDRFLVQEFIDGRNLAQELTAEGAFNEAKIWQLLNELLPLLTFIHSHKVIHRDIKPENIIRRRYPLTEGSEDLVLVDFGSAKHASETKLSKTGTTIGSAAYSAPEQVLGKAIFASDIYSLGVTCIHLLTAISPFDLFDSREHTWIWRQYLQRIQAQNRLPQKDPQSQKTDAYHKSTLKHAFSEHLGQVLDKMLASGTNQRFPSAKLAMAALNAPPQPEVLLKLQRSFKKKWVVAATLLLLGCVGVRYMMSPIAQNVSRSQPFVQQSGASEHQDSRNFGGLYGTTAESKQGFPLQHTEVMAKVSGNVSRVEVVQTFTNPYKQPLEATYVFPLPDDAAVDDMEIKVGDRIIRGLIKKREEAKKIYEQAKHEGKTAGLLEQERDNIFTQSVANIKPGEKIEVTIRYTESLKFEKGNYQFVFPMVIGPRYIPGDDKETKPTVEAKDSGGKAKVVADAAKITPSTLPPDTRTGQDIGVTVEIEAGVPIAQVQSTSHQIHTTQDGRILRVTLDRQDTIPNKDLVINYQVSGNDTQDTLLAQTDERGGHFAAYLIPAVDYQSDRIVPKDVVFLMDTSGSQAGAPIVQSQELMRHFIKGLNPNDTFTIIDFANTSTSLSTQPLENTPQNRDRAIAYIDRLSANGGSELMNGINTVLNFPPAKDGRLRSVVLLTDGLIGNDEQVIGEVSRRLPVGNRLYGFGVGTSVNRFLIERVAELGRGKARMVRPDEAAQPVVEKFLTQINNPILTNIEVKWEGTGAPPEIYPAQPTDLFANQPLVVYGRKGDRTSGTLRIRGIAAGGKLYEKAIPVNFANGGNPAIAQLWGRARIHELMNQMYNRETNSGIEAVTKTALDYRLLSKYTAFVAVSDDMRVDPSLGVEKVEVPVQMQQGTGNTQVPEPGQIFGSLAALLLLGGALSHKRAKHLRRSLQRKNA
ncbi:VIT domain-containing protein [Tumidithrix elongata RA019]|uniref:VIT domain-containing protein n=1 Tax=Tumidithrix elongata BACA0141 TaxID=2716417 RepID=A0AAW9PP32_9CYAN|nr:VIT domain-containing protein [Tumidithrix elongata RA019]